MEVELPDLGQLLKEVGPLVDANEVREHDGAWLLCFPEELIVLVEEDAYRDCLVLTTELGFPQPGQEKPVYKLLLQVAARWQDMQGIRMGLDPEDDCVLQIADVSKTNLTLETLAERVDGFVATARHCSKALAQLEDSSQHPQTFIRV